MTKRIFKAICTAALGVFVVTMLLIMGVLYEYFSTVQQSQLKSQTTLAAQGVENQGIRYFDGLTAEHFRITWIAANGDVLYDSATDSDTMDNHVQREEIRQALNTGYGESSRYSSTLMKRYLYSAQRLSDGTVLRLSITHNTIFVLLIGMLQPILIVMAVAAVLSFVLANGLSKRIVEPLNRLNLDEPLNNDGYDELAPLLRRIHSQQQQLTVQKNSLTQKQNEFDAIVGQLEEGMILLDKNGKVITANQSAARLLDAKNKPMHGADLLSVNRNLELQEAVREAMAGGNAARKTTMHGRTIHIQAAAIGTQTVISGVAVVLFDITQAEQAEQRRREFTANVSHELKTPLQSISGYSELLKCGMTKTEDVEPFAGRIYSEAQRLISLVEDIINLSHLDAGTGYEWSQVDLLNAARKVTEELSDIAAENGIALHLDGEPAVICGIPELVHGIVYNLCDNAIKYNRPNGEVSVTVSHNGAAAVLTVKDTGIGIPEADLDRIFERFYRVDKSRSKAVGGTGLGLSIVKHAAMLMNAQIEVDSRVQEGTAITIAFQEKKQ